MAKGPRKPSRAQVRARLLAEAAAVALPDSIDVCVCGGGAAGLAAAIAAAEAGASVIVLERSLRCGESILATGGGRCNLTRSDLDAQAYNDPAFVSAVCGPRFPADVLAFFDACGLATSFEGADDARVYPLSDQAASVRAVLLSRAVRAGVILGCGREVIRVEGGTVAFRELFSERTRSVHAAAIVLAGRDGCVPAELDSAPFSPVLCPLAATGLPFEQLDGRRVHARATLQRDGATVHTEYGEVLFRAYGLSGIVIFNLSRFAQAGDTVELDLAPTCDDDTFARLAARAGGAFGLIDPAIVKVLGDAKRVSCTVEGLARTERAQVRRGGLCTAQFDPATLMVRARPGLFAAGELIDVDGPCGGYNLSWAWQSGRIAGAAAADHARSRAGA